jgi:hypothetical protein
MPFFFFFFVGTLMMYFPPVFSVDDVVNLDCGSFYNYSFCGILDKNIDQ